MAAYSAARGRKREVGFFISEIPLDIKCRGYGFIIAYFRAECKAVFPKCLVFSVKFAFSPCKIPRNMV
jgi:hypothetical protein